METKKDIYMISLDAVDLNSLPISQRHSDGGAVPLWSMSHLDKRRNDYYEFVIKTDDTEEDLSEPVIKHVTCHICDINVPEVYFNEHKNGFRHKFNKKVTDTALKRLQMYVDKDYINKTNEQLPSKHFCVECSIVINSEDETSHKQTTAHRSSVSLERYLDGFLNFYANDDNEAVDNKSKDIKSGHEITHDSEDNASRTDDSESLADVNKKTDPLDTVNGLEPHTSVPVHPKVVCDTCNAWISKKQFRKHKKTPRHIFNTISDYHYLFKPFNDEYIYCLVCKGPIPNDMEIIKEHYYCRSHIRKYNKLLDAHSIIRVYRNQFYCIVCNYYMLQKNDYTHMKMKTHSDQVGFCELDEIEVESDVSADADDTNADRNTSEDQETRTGGNGSNDY